MSLTSGTEVSETLQGQTSCTLTTILGIGEKGQVSAPQVLRMLVYIENRWKVRLSVTISGWIPEDISWKFGNGNGTSPIVHDTGIPFGEHLTTFSNVVAALVCVPSCIANP